MTARTSSARSRHRPYAAFAAVATASLFAQLFVAPLHHVHIAAGRHTDHCHVVVAKPDGYRTSVSLPEAGDRHEQHRGDHHDEHSCAVCLVFARVSQGFCGTATAVAIAASEPVDSATTLAFQVPFVRFNLSSPTARGPPCLAADAIRRVSLRPGPYGSGVPHVAA
jgi:hypothetical protein